MPAIELTPAERKALKAEAHALSPVAAIGKAEFEDLLAHGGRRVARDEFAGEAVATDDAGEGRADQPEADDDDPTEERSGARHRAQPFMKAERLATTARISSSVPMVKRMKSGRP
jgi:hypothetical protein